MSWNEGNCEILNYSRLLNGWQLWRNCVSAEVWFFRCNKGCLNPVRKFGTQQLLEVASLHRSLLVLFSRLTTQCTFEPPCRKIYEKPSKNCTEYFTGRPVSTNWLLKHQSYRSFSEKLLFLPMVLTLAITSSNVLSLFRSLMFEWKVRICLKSRSVFLNLFMLATQQKIINFRLKVALVCKWVVAQT